MLLLLTDLFACNRRWDQSIYVNFMKHIMIQEHFCLFLKRDQDHLLPILASSHHQLSFYFVLLLNLNFDNFSRKNCHLRRIMGWVIWEKLGFTSHCTNHLWYFWIDDQVYQIFHSEASTYILAFFLPSTLWYIQELSSDFRT